MRINQSAAASAGRIELPAQDSPARGKAAGAAGAATLTPSETPITEGSIRMRSGCTAGVLAPRVAELVSKGLAPDVEQQRMSGWLSRQWGASGVWGDVFVVAEGDRLQMEDRRIPEDHFEPTHVLVAVDILAMPGQSDAATEWFKFVATVRDLGGQRTRAITFRTSDQDAFSRWYSMLYTNCFGEANRKAVLDLAPICLRYADELTSGAVPLDFKAGMLRYLRERFPGGLEGMLQEEEAMRERAERRRQTWFFRRGGESKADVKEEEQWLVVLKYLQSIPCVRVCSGLADAQEMEPVLVLDAEYFTACHTLIVEYCHVTSVTGMGRIKNLVVSHSQVDLAELQEARIEFLEIRGSEGRWLDEFAFGGIATLASTLTNLRINHTTLDDLDIVLRSAPSAVPSWGALRYLDVSNNNLRKLPASLQHLTGLEKLVLDNNGIERLEHLREPGRHLAWLSAKNNCLSNVSALVQCENLAVLDLSHNYIADFPWQYLVHLRVLRLANNQIQSRAGVRELARGNTGAAVCPDLGELELHHNPFSDDAAEDYRPILLTLFAGHLQQHRGMVIDGEVAKPPSRGVMAKQVERHPDIFRTTPVTQSGGAPRVVVRVKRSRGQRRANGSTVPVPKGGASPEGSEAMQPSPAEQQLEAPPAPEPVKHETVPPPPRRTSWSGSPPREAQGGRRSRQSTPSRSPPPDAEATPMQEKLPGIIPPPEPQAAAALRVSAAPPGDDEFNASPFGSPQGEWSVLLVRERNHAMGCRFRQVGDGAVVLMEVGEGTPAENCGLRRFIGKQLVTMNNIPIESHDDVTHYSRGATRLNLAFGPPPSGWADEDSFGEEESSGSEFGFGDIRTEGHELLAPRQRDTVAARAFHAFRSQLSIPMQAMVERLEEDEAPGCCSCAACGRVGNWYRKYWRSIGRRRWAKTQRLLVILCHIHVFLVAPFAFAFISLSCADCTDDHASAKFRLFVSVLVMIATWFQTVFGIFALFFENVVLLVMFNLLTAVLAGRYIFSLSYYYNGSDYNKRIVLIPAVVELTFMSFYLFVSALIFFHFNRLTILRVGASEHLISAYRRLQVYSALSRVDLLFTAMNAVVVAFWYLTEWWEWIPFAAVCVIALWMWPLSLAWVVAERRRMLSLFACVAVAMLGGQCYLGYVVFAKRGSEVKHLQYAYDVSAMTVTAGVVIRVATLVCLMLCTRDFGKGLKQALDADRVTLTHGKLVNTV